MTKKEKRGGNYLADTAFAGLMAALGGDERGDSGGDGGVLAKALALGFAALPAHGVVPLAHRPRRRRGRGGGGGMRRLSFLSKDSDPHNTRERGTL